MPNYNMTFYKMHHVKTRDATGVFEESVPQGCSAIMRSRKSEISGTFGPISTSLVFLNFQVVFVENTHIVFWFKPQYIQYTMTKRLPLLFH